jgi:galactonate dehydratase
MKITDIKIIPALKYVFIKVETDESIYGLGEMGAWGYLDACTAALEYIKEYLIGKDPLRIEHHFNYLYRSMYFRGNILLSALSAVDIALWDILGKKLNVPIYQLLGGKTREKVRTYAAVFESDPKKMAAGCKALKEKGFDAARLMICGDIRSDQVSRKETIFNYKIEDYVKRVKVCREAVGEEFDLCLEVHRSMSPSEAVAFARRVEKYNPLFIEDPIAPDSIDSLAQVAQKINIPIATGERGINIQELAAIAKQNAANYLRPDVCVIGGITAAKKVASLAEANYMKVAPHNPLGPISTAACLQLDASIPNFLIQEFPSFYMKGNEAKMLKNPFKIEEGYIYIPDGPGLA